MLKTVSSITNAIGALNYKGTWNATTNTPTIVSSTGTKGDYYVVNVAGATTIDGISNWGVGDWIVFNGAVWQRVEGGADLNGVNLSVSGTTTLSGLTASTALALDASKDVVSVTNTGTGDNVLGTSPTLTTPKVVTAITDSNGNEVIGITATASAVNELTIANSATTVRPSISATGSDTNIGIDFLPKGSGSTRFVLGTSGSVNINTAGAADQTGLSISNTDYGSAGTRRIYFNLGASNINVNTTNIGGFSYSSSLTLANTRFNGANYVLRDAMTLDDDSNVFFPNIGTTASAANAFLDSGSSPANSLLRSTSSIRYKTEVEDIEPNRADAILSMRPVWYRSLCDNDRKDWSWYGLIAEEVAELEPRLVHWAYSEDDYVITTVEKERETVVGQDQNGQDIVEIVKQLEEVKTLKDGAQKVPDGVQYDRLTVLLIKKIQDQQKMIDDLASRLSALESN